MRQGRQAHSGRDGGREGKIDHGPNERRRRFGARRRRYCDIHFNADAPPGNIERPIHAARFADAAHPEAKARAGPVGRYDAPICDFSFKVVHFSPAARVRDPRIARGYADVICASPHVMVGHTAGQKVPIKAYLRGITRGDGAVYVVLPKRQKGKRIETTRTSPERTSQVSPKQSLQKSERGPQRPHPTLPRDPQLKGAEVFLKNSIPDFALFTKNAENKMKQK